MLVFVSSALDTSAATTILSALAVRRGSQVVRSRSAKPLFAGSIPAPASRSRSVSLNNEISFHAPVRLIRRRPTAHPYGLRPMSLGSRRLHSRPRLKVSLGFVEQRDCHSTRRFDWFAVARQLTLTGFVLCRSGPRRLHSRPRLFDGNDQFRKHE